MQLLALSLGNFRNYQRAHLTFSPTLNQFHGANAQGKTNIIEALYLFVTGRSFRTRRLSDLIRWDSDGFVITLRFRLHDVEQSLQISYTANERRILHNETPCQSLSELFGLVPGVIFAPDDQALISGSPARRRRFLDLHLSKLDPLYLDHLARYYQALKQRNALLRQAKLETIEAWEAPMAVSAGYLTAQRLVALSELKTRAAHYHSLLSDGNEHFSLQLDSRLPEKPCELESFYRASLAQHRPREARLGHTLVGPHRDDLSLLIDERDGRLFASEGQKACASLALRLAERSRLESYGHTPILLIDDVAHRLDQRRRHLLYNELLGSAQCFLAAPTPLDEGDSSGKHFHIISGTVQEDSSALREHQQPASAHP